MAEEQKDVPEPTEPVYVWKVQYLDAIFNVVACDAISAINIANAYEDTSPKGLLAGVVLAAFVFCVMYVVNPEATKYFWEMGAKFLGSGILFFATLIIRVIKLLLTGSPD